jgi:hypothetical protein
MQSSHTRSKTFLTDFFRRLSSKNFFLVTTPQPANPNPENLPLFAPINQSLHAAGASRMNDSPAEPGNPVQTCARGTEFHFCH